MHLEELRNKRVIITGASQGIGRATAKMFAKAGAIVGLISRSKVGLNDIYSEIIEANGKAKILLCDVSNYEEFSDSIKKFVNEYLSIDILIGNAGIIEPIATIENLDPHEFSTSIDINLKGIFYGIITALPFFIKQGYGTVINVSSGAANYPIEGWSAYCSGKAGCAMLTQSLHKEYYDKGIISIGLSPGTVATAMQKKIRSSGINSISAMDPSSHIEPIVPAKALCWLSTSRGRKFSGQEVSLKDPNILKNLELFHF
jgi:NADP-dependent 3-hydroxy acid dehydrogenase YdfG